MRPLISSPYFRPCSAGGQTTCASSSKLIILRMRKRSRYGQSSPLTTCGLPQLPPACSSPQGAYQSNALTGTASPVQTKHGPRGRRHSAPKNSLSIANSARMGIGGTSLSARPPQSPFTASPPTWEYQASCSHLTLLHSMRRRRTPPCPHACR